MCLLSCFQIWTKTVFPVHFQCFWCKFGSMVVLFNSVYVLACLLCVCFFLNEVGMFMCVLSSSKHKARLFARLDLAVWFLFVCFLLMLFSRNFVFFSLARNRSKIRTQQETRKCKDRTKTVSSVSAVVFTNSVPNFGVGLKMHCCSKRYENCGFSKT